MTETTMTSSTALALWLESRLMEWEKAREPQKQKLLECYQDKMRIHRDDDTAGTGMARSRKAKGLFVGSTRNKIRSARAKINDALFGNGKLPFDTEPTNESLAPYSDTMEDILTDQLQRMKFKEMISEGVDLLATYGTGYIFGPFVREEKIVETSADTSDGFPQIVEREVKFDLPYFMLANTLDVIPDAEARNVETALGVFWVTMESKHTVAAWKRDSRYKNVDQALQGGSDNGNETGSEQASQLRGNVEYWFKSDRIKVARYFGKVPRSALAEQTGIEDEVTASDEMVDVVVVMAGGVVVKVGENLYGSKNPTHRCVYESEPNEMDGVGVGENNAPHQKTVNAAFRLFMEGKGMALLGTKAVDRSAFLPTENFQKYPGKVYQFKPGLSVDEKKAAIIEFTEQDVTSGWLDVIRVSEQFSDDDTGITKYTQGDDSQNLNKTATGISMIMSASSLPMKEVIQHIDSMWIEPIIECLVNWNLKYLEVETVQKIHGDEAAKKWAQIKQFGKSSFMNWKAVGTKSFMAKEVLTNKIMTFINLVTAHPQFANKVDFIELLEQAWSFMEIGGESPILKDDSKIPPQAKMQMQQMQEMIQQLDQAIQKMHEEIESKNIEEKKLALENRKLDIEEEKIAAGAALGSATAGVPLPDLMARFDAIEQMLLDVMKNSGHLDHVMPAQTEPPEMPIEDAEPHPESEEPPGQPELQPEQQPADAGFFTPGDQQ